MKITSLFIIVFLFVFAPQTDAQNRFIVHEDTRVQLLSNLKDSIIICHFTKKDRGFRILVNITDNREAAYHLKHKLQERYIGYNVYMSYQTPNFKLKIGDFLRKEDAEDLRKQLSITIKQNIYIVPDLVILKPDDIEKRLNEGKQSGCLDLIPCVIFL